MPAVPLDNLLADCEWPMELHGVPRAGRRSRRLALGLVDVLLQALADDEGGEVVMQQHDIHVSDVRCVPSSAKDAASGLLGFVSFRIGNALSVDGVVVRRTLDNRITLSWPCRVDRAGRKHPILRPLDDAARQRLEQLILKAIAANPEVLP